MSTFFVAQFLDIKTKVQTIQHNSHRFIKTCKHAGTVAVLFLGQEPWSGGYGIQLVFRRLWVRIPALYTGWTRHFLQLFDVKIVLFV